MYLQISNPSSYCIFGQTAAGSEAVDLLVSVSPGGHSELIPVVNTSGWTGIPRQLWRRHAETGPEGVWAPPLRRPEGARPIRQTRGTQTTAYITRECSVINLHYLYCKYPQHELSAGNKTALMNSFMCVPSAPCQADMLPASDSYLVFNNLFNIFKEAHYSTWHVDT